MKRFLSFLLVAVMICMAIPALGAAEEPVTLRVAWWGSQTRHDKTMEAIAKFEEKNPGIKVEAEFTDWGGYWSKLATQVAGGLTPDVIQMDYAYLAQYGENGVLADLTPYIESGAINTENVAEDVLGIGKVGDKIFALSTGTNANTFMYRKDIAEQAGVEVPIEPTLEQFYEICATVYEKTGRTNVVPSGYESLRMLLRAYGLQFFNEDGTALGFDDPQYIVRQWQDYLDGEAAGWSIPVGENTNTSDFDTLVNDQWMAGQWTNQLAMMEENNSCELELVCYPDPADRTVPSTYLKPTMFWSVAEMSEVKDAAVKFIDFYTNDTDCADIMLIDRGMPISSAIREHITPNLDSASQKIAAFMDYLAQDGKTTPIMKVDPVGSAEVFALYGTYCEAVAYHQVEDLTAWAQQFMDEANVILANATKAE